MGIARADDHSVGATGILSVESVDGGDANVLAGARLDASASLGDHVELKGGIGAVGDGPRIVGVGELTWVQDDDGSGLILRWRPWEADPTYERFALPELGVRLGEKNNHVDLTLGVPTTLIPSAFVRDRASGWTTAEDGRIAARAVVGGDARVSASAEAVVGFDASDYTAYADAVEGFEAIGDALGQELDIHANGSLGIAVALDRAKRVRAGLGLAGAVTEVTDTDGDTHLGMGLTPSGGVTAVW